MPKQLRFLIRFRKESNTKYLSHRELLNLFEQTIRRTELPVTFSEGFNPRPRLSFPTALPLGVSSADEIMLLQLTEWVNPSVIIDKINQKSAHNVAVTSCEVFNDSDAEKIKSGFDAEYVVSPINNNGLTSLKALSNDKINGWLKQQSQVIKRDYINKESKSINIRPFVQSVIEKDQTVIITIRITNSGTTRPEEILSSLGISEIKENFSIHKSRTLI